MTAPRYEAEGAKPFSYTTSGKTVVVQSYRVLPERLYDDPEELAAGPGGGRLRSARRFQTAKTKHQRRGRENQRQNRAQKRAAKSQATKSKAGMRKGVVKRAKTKSRKR